MCDGGKCELSIQKWFQRFKKYFKNPNNVYDGTCLHASRHISTSVFSTCTGMCICRPSSLIPQLSLSAGSCLTWESKDPKSHVYRISDQQQQTAKVTLTTVSAHCSLSVRATPSSICSLSLHQPDSLS